MLDSGGTPKKTLITSPTVGYQRISQNWPKHARSPFRSAMTYLTPDRGNGRRMSVELRIARPRAARFTDQKWPYGRLRIRRQQFVVEAAMGQLQRIIGVADVIHSAPAMICHAWPSGSAATPAKPQSC